MVATKGFRDNVGIIITNDEKKLLLARRIGTQNAWQFPQGGVDTGESLQAAMYRELREELGIEPGNVQMIAESKHWLKYRLPVRFQRRDDDPALRCIGQNQKWFLLKLVGGNECVHLDASDHPEFDAWRWVSYWYPIKQVIYFKRYVYRQV